MSVVVRRLRALPSVQLTFAVALLVLGFLIAAQIAAEGPGIRYSTEERSPLYETGAALQSRQETLRSVILSLRGRSGALEAQGPDAADSLRGLYAQLEEARVAAGLISLRGLGIAFQLEDSGQGAGPDGLVTAH